MNHTCVYIYRVWTESLGPFVCCPSFSRSHHHYHYHHTPRLYSLGPHPRGRPTTGSRRQLPAAEHGYTGPTTGPSLYSQRPTPEAPYTTAQPQCCYGETNKKVAFNQLARGLELLEGKARGKGSTQARGTNGTRRHTMEVSMQKVAKAKERAREINNYRVSPCLCSRWPRHKPHCSKYSPNSPYQRHHRTSSQTYYRHQRRQNQRWRNGSVQTARPATTR